MIEEREDRGVIELFFFFVHACGIHRDRFRQ